MSVNHFLRAAATLMFAAALHGQWTQFRGPNGSGAGASSGYPAEFSPSKNVVWKSAVPYGQSSPVLAGNHLYLTASDGDRLLTLCFDAQNGKELWRREIKRAHTHKLFRANDPASPTPAADDNGVYVFFADYGLAAYTPDGKPRWTLPLGPFENFYGMGASPVLAGDLLVLLCDQQSNSFLLALDRSTGRERWKTARSGVPIGWATPMVFRPSKGPEQLIVLGSTRLDSYVLATGEQRWWTRLSSEGALGVPAAAGDTIFVATPGSNEPWMPAFESMLAKYDKDKDGRIAHDEFKADELFEHFGWIDTDKDNFLTAAEWNYARDMAIGPWGAVAIRPAESKGELPGSAIQWRYQKGLPMMPAPLLYQDVFYMVRDGGIITALNPSTGKVLKQGRSPQALGDYYASPIAADGKVFLANTEGKITVLKSGADWQVLSVNDMGDEVHATPALSEGRVYVRTHGWLYCFGLQRASR